MGEVRSCLYFLVYCLCVQISIAKPFFGPRFWCDLLCEEDDGFTTTASYEDYYDALCNDCPTRRPSTPTTMMPPANQPQAANFTKAGSIRM
ncbi:hypothetical protein HF086_007685 [Spodoptera exigua]|uniref:Uncharacterized protein n=1 Tax=Spodoptera exigua TaxID=7107 RepID=A0A922MT60_SPOEX|nr:hypothetical protein HF086_007685 [Spodoptera exigua]